MHLDKVVRPLMTRGGVRRVVLRLQVAEGLHAKERRECP